MLGLLVTIKERQREQENNNARTEDSLVLVNVRV